MFITKKKHKKILDEKDAEIMHLKLAMRDTEYFYKLGVQCAQQTLRGYKWIEHKSYLSDSFRYSFKSALLLADKLEGGLESKIRKFLECLDASVFCSMFTQEDVKRINHKAKMSDDAKKKNQHSEILKKLKKVTDVSAHTSPPKPYEEIRTVSNKQVQGG